MLSRNNSNKKNKKAALSSVRRRSLQDLWSALSSEVLLVCDSQWRIIHAEGKCMSLFAASAENCCGMNFATMVDLEQRLFLEQQLETLEESGAILELELISHAGDMRPLEVRILQQSTKEIALLLRDVSERKSKEKLLDQLLNGRDNIRRMQNQFISNVTHELRTPLHAINGFAEILLSEEENSTRRGYLEHIVNSAHLLTREVDNLIQLSRLEGEKYKVEKKAVNVRGVLSEVRAAYEVEAHAKGLDFLMEISNRLPELVNIDPMVVKHVLQHVISNAVTFTKSGFVHVFADCLHVFGGSKELVLLVEDSGVGMEPQHLGRLFDRFERGCSSTQPDNIGLGVGLALSRKLVESCGGYIEVDTNVGRGTLFKIYLPDVQLEVLDEELLVQDEPVCYVPLFKESKILLCCKNIADELILKGMLQRMNLQSFVLTPAELALGTTEHDEAVVLLALPKNEQRKLLEQISERYLHCILVQDEELSEILPENRAFMTYPLTLNDLAEALMVFLDPQQESEQSHLKPLLKKSSVSTDKEERPQSEILSALVVQIGELCQHSAETLPYEAVIKLCAQLTHVSNERIEKLTQNLKSRQEDFDNQGMCDCLQLLLDNLVELTHS